MGKYRTLIRRGSLTGDLGGKMCSLLVIPDRLINLIQI